MNTTHWTMVALLVTAGGQLAACSKPAADPNRARCKEQMETYYRLTGAPDFLDKGYGDRALDAVIGFANQVKDSKDAYCALVREKADEIQKKRAERAKEESEVVAAVAQLRTVGAPPPIWRDASVQAKPDAAAAAAAADAAPPAPTAKPSPPTPKPDPPPGTPSEPTYCRYNVVVNGVTMPRTYCEPGTPSEAEAICVENQRKANNPNPACFCTRDPAYTKDKCR